MIRPLLSTLTVLLMVAGCYAYTPTTAVLSPGTQVRLHLPTGDAIRVSERLGRITQAIDGTTVLAPHDSLAVTLWTDLTGGAARFTPADTFRFERASLVRIEEKRFSVGRTLLFGGAGSAVGAALILLLWDRVGGTGGPGTGGGDH